MRRAQLLLKGLRTRFVDQRPFILSHLLTARCNADCATCLWKMPADSRADEMSAEEIEALYRDAAQAGFLGLVLWGGEPTLRPDVGRVLAAAKRFGLNTTLITNGWWLDARGDEFLPAVDRLLVSVDAIGPLHDEIRRSQGLFERLDRGLVKVRRDYPDVRVLIMCVLSHLNEGELESVARYGREHGAQVLFQAMNVTDYGFADRALDLERLLLDAEAERRIARRIHALRREGYPVRDSGAYLRRLGGDAGAYRCHYKKVVLRVEPNGDVLDCTKTAFTLASTRDTSLGELTKGPIFADFVRRAEGCNRCRDAGVIETSHMWEGRVGALWNALATLF